MRRRTPRGTLTTLCTAAFALSGGAAADAAFTESRILGSGAGTAAGQLDGPQSVDVGPDGAVYVADSINERVVKLDPGGAFERTWGKDVAVAGGTGFEVCLTGCKAGVDGVGPGETQGVEDVAVSPDGSAVYITDDGNRRISQYAADGTFVRTFGQDGTDGGDLRRPGAIAVGPSGDVYVTETINNRISQFTALGVFVRAFGVDVDAGGGNGYETCTVDCQAGITGDAEGIAVTAAGEVYVTNPDDDHVARYSAAGAFLGTFAGEGSGAATIVNPQSVDVGASGDVLLTESGGANTIFRFRAGPDFLETFQLGPEFVNAPTDAAVAPDGSAYVAQRGRDRIVRYTLDAAPGPPPVVPPAPAPVPAAAKPPALAALPKAASVIVLPSAKQCVSRRNFRIRLRQPKGFTLKSATVSLNGRRVAKRSGKRVTAPVDLRGLPKGRFTVKISVTLTDGRKVNSSRTYRTCAPKRR